MNRPIVYALIDPRTNDVRYVGKSNDPNKRLMAHMSPSAHSPAIRRWSDDLRSVGLRARLRILGEGTEAEWIIRLQPDLNANPGESSDRTSKKSVLSPDVLVRIKELCSEVGPAMAARHLDISPSTLAHARCGDPLMPSTVALIEKNLALVDVPRGTSPAKEST